MAILYTIGHSNRPIEEFLEILKSYEIDTLVDVRSIPKSRYVPQFNQENLKASLKKIHVSYKHNKTLGGRRKANPFSQNDGWHHPAFRGYADYMQTKDFYIGLKDILHLVNRGKNVAIMCAEALPWRCHRSLIADAIVIRKIKVMDIFNKSTTKPHHLTSFAVVDKTTRPFKIIYPHQNISLFSE